MLYLEDLMILSFKLQSTSLFWYLDNFLEKDNTDLLFQINIAWSVFTGLINCRGFRLSHIYTIQLYRV